MHRGADEARVLLVEHVDKVREAPGLVVVLDAELRDVVEHPGVEALRQHEVVVGAVPRQRGSPTSTHSDSRYVRDVYI